MAFWRIIVNSFVNMIYFFSCACFSKIEKTRADGGKGMIPVQGTPVYTAEKFSDLRDLIVSTCAKYSELGSTGVIMNSGMISKVLQLISLTANMRIRGLR